MNALQSIPLEFLLFLECGRRDVDLFQVTALRRAGSLFLTSWNLLELLDAGEKSGYSTGKAKERNHSMFRWRGRSLKLQGDLGAECHGMVNS
jgi:hypothetical protein